MGCYAWETATILLPAKEVPALHKALRDTHNELRTMALTRAKDLHRSIATSSPKKYREALIETRRAQQARASRPGFFGTSVRCAPVLSRIADTMAYALLNEVNGGTWGEARETKPAAPRTPTTTDMDRLMTTATSRTKSFPIISNGDYPEGSLVFEGRTLTWSVTENKNAVRDAHDGPTAHVFFGYLDKLTWTRGSGGYGVGNDEYNESDDLGGGANYLTFSYGPTGEAARARQMGVTLAKYRTLMGTSTSSKGHAQRH